MGGVEPWQIGAIGANWVVVVVMHSDVQVTVFGGVQIPTQVKVKVTD